jgi:hypothetical protein
MMLEQGVATKAVVYPVSIEELMHADWKFHSDETR